MSRLLRFNESGRPDLVVHLALGAAAVAAAVICLCATFEFASGLDRIVERLSARPAAANYTTPNDEPLNSLTNVADLELGPVGTGASTQSDPAVGQPAAGRATDLPTG
jgi:hypothetical protein